jgi:hypothetical protein
LKLYRQKIFDFVLNPDLSYHFTSNVPDEEINRKRLVGSFSNKRLFSNYRVLSPEGNLLFYCDLKRLLFYVNKNLAKYIDQNTIQLTFVPGGPGNQSYKANECFICNSKEQLTRHHSVPYCYTKYFPAKYKDHKTEDIVGLCSKCHCEYEILAEQYKYELFNVYGFNVMSQKNRDRILQFYGKYIRFNKNINRIPKIGLERYKNKMLALEEYIKELNGSMPSIEEMKTILVMKKRKEMYKQFHEYIKHDIENFIQLWKNHFKDYLVNKGVVVDK